MRIAGVDGCKKGWVAVWEMDDGRVEVQQFGSVIDILQRKPDLVVIDIPIGLVETGFRLADKQARAFLKSRGCCVFNAPLRGMLKCADYRAACNLGQQIHQKGISIQTWAITQKIKEVDEAISFMSQSVVREGHPEVSFAVMNGGSAVSFKKASAAGREVRMELLSAHFSGVKSTIQKHSGLREDVIDAYAMLWTARRIRDRAALSFPEISDSDSRGLSMQIWA